MSRKVRLTFRKDNAFAKAFVYFILFILIIYGLIMLYELAKPYFLQIGIAIFILVGFVIYWQVKKYVERRRIVGELGNHLLKALASMDNIARTYKNEDEANKELVSELRHQKINAIHESLGDAKGADIRVGDILIEGKLEPDKGEVDRLLGQLQDYCKHHYKVYVVVYGRLDEKHLKRITEEIKDRYNGEVFLVHLKKPRRRKAESIG